MRHNGALNCFLKSYRLLGLAALAVALAAINILISPWVIRQDITENKLYTLSQGTIDLVASLEHPVTVKLYFNSSDPQIPVMLKQYAQQVREVLNEYVVLSHGDIILEVYDPEPDTRAEDWALRYGLRGQMLSPAGPVLYFGLVMTCGDKDALIPMLDPRGASMLEYRIDQLLVKVTEERRPVVGVMSELPVLGHPVADVMGATGIDRGWAPFVELRDNFDLRSVSSAATHIDDHLSSLIMVNPRQLSDDTLRAIDTYVGQGGHLIVFVDPLSYAGGEAEEIPRAMDRHCSMTQLFEKWGISYNPQKVVADLQAASPIKGPRGQLLENPVWLSLYRGGVQPDHIITSQLATLLFPAAGAFTYVVTGDLTAVPLLHTSKSSYTVDARTAKTQNMTRLRALYKESDTEEHVIALLLRGRFPSAFDSENHALGKTAAVLLVGDSDLLYNPFCTKPSSRYGTSVDQPINDNIAFVLNAVENMAGSDYLLNIRSRGNNVYPFTIVQQMLREVQVRYIAQEQALEQQLAATRAQLKAIEQQNEQAPQLVLTETQRNALETSRKQEYQIKQQLRTLRRELTGDIERLGMLIKAVNMLLMPLLVCLFGIGFWLIRRVRAS
ncbi:MAG: hypothetical protein EOL87_00145 [Spartobacteria bacterium]|nr:hypothetical protein [Spartobacteria bacterium]